MRSFSWSCRLTTHNSYSTIILFRKGLVGMRNKKWVLWEHEFVRFQGLCASAEKQMRLIHTVADLEISTFLRPSTKIIHWDDLSTRCSTVARLSSYGCHQCKTFLLMWKSYWDTDLLTNIRFRRLGERYQISQFIESIVFQSKLRQE